MSEVAMLEALPTVQPQEATVIPGQTADKPAADFKQVLRDSTQGTQAGSAKDKEAKDPKVQDEALAEKAKDTKKAQESAGYLGISGPMLYKQLEALLKQLETSQTADKQVISDLKAVVKDLAENKSLAGPWLQQRTALASVQANALNMPVQQTGQLTYHEVLDKLDQLMKKHPELAAGIKAAITKAQVKAGQTKVAALSGNDQQLEVAERPTTTVKKISQDTVRPVQSAYVREQTSAMTAADQPAAGADQVKKSAAVKDTSHVLPVTQMQRSDQKQVAATEDSSEKKLAKLTLEPKVQTTQRTTPELMVITQGNRQIEIRTAPTTSVTDASAFRRNIINQIENGVKMQYNPPQNEVKIKLNPPTLGEVTIKVQLTEDKVTAGKHALSANIVVESESVKDAVMASAQQLKHSLQENSGLNLRDFSVTVRTGQDMPQQQREQQAYQLKRKKSFFDDEEDLDIPATLKEVDMNLQGIYNYVA